MTATTTTLPVPTTGHVPRYIGFALAILLAFSVGMITSVVLFDDDESPAARSAATESPASTSASAAPTMSADAAERWATSETEAFQRKASVESAERQAAARAEADPSQASDGCRATAQAPDALERCVGTGR